MIIVYKGSPITFWIGKRVAKIDHMGLPNIIANKTIVPELLQDAATTETIAKTAKNLLDNSNEYEKMHSALVQIERQLQGRKYSLVE